MMRHAHPFSTLPGDAAFYKSAHFAQLSANHTIIVTEKCQKAKKNTYQYSIVSRATFIVYYHALLFS